MKRFFYTDPLAAAWMARHHGLKILGPVLEAATGKRITSSRPMPVWILARAIEAAEKGICGDDDKYFVHQDSLHLLDPQIKDCVLIKSEGVVGFIYAGGLFGLHKVLPRKDTQMRIGECYPANDLTIIQRDGVAFMWPESDGA